jgi:Asp-tRNA(Asn)/Glu-tRNA(Gln) amidotransferase A subunit family amidase
MGSFLAVSAVRQPALAQCLGALLVAAVLLGCQAEPDRSVGTRTGLQLVELTIDGAHRALADGRISCMGLTQGYLERIAAYDPPPATERALASREARPASIPRSGPDELNAIIRINPKALNRAQQLDDEYARLGRLRRLHCIPVILKDNFDTADMPTEAGSVALARSLPPDDAFMVRRLRAAGAIMLAKSNMGEWAFSPYRTISSTHGETRNAYALARVPAGSSGGTASAIAASLGIIGMGTDTGNSIRGPASHLALVGIRSTLGATSRDGIVPLLANRDVGGPMLRTVRDTAIVYSVLAGHDPADPVTEAVRERPSASPLLGLSADGLVGARLGVLRALVDIGGADPEVVAVFEQALAELKRAGATLVDPFEIPRFAELTDAAGFCSRFRHDLAGYLASLGPAAPVRSLDEIVATGRYLPRHRGAMDWAMAEKGDPAAQEPPCVGVEGDPRRKALLDAVLAAMDAVRIDAILYPSWRNPPRRIGDEDSPHGNNSPVIAPHSGQPAITVPMGFTATGLPLGLQMLGRPFDEARLFRYAYAYEQATRHRRPPPRYGPLK